MIGIFCIVLALLGSDPTGTVTGHVVEARTGAPLAAVLVKVQSTGQQALSDADGRFEIPDVPAGPQTLLVSVVGYGLVRRDVAVVADRPVDVTIPVAEGASGYVEEVQVGASRFRQAEAGVASQQVLGSRDLLALRGVIADDPFRAVQVMPTVATGDDFQAEFAVRGHGPAHVGIALDGIDTPLLFHTVRAVGDTGSLALINSDILDAATLLSGAYPQMMGSHLGSRLEFTTREPARDRLTARVLVSGTAATTVWEGPAGSRAGWMVAARKSYIDWLLKKIDPTIEGTFGFTDGQAKFVFNPSPHHALQASIIGGRSLLNEEDESPGLNSLDQGRSNTTIGNLRWQFTPSARFVLTQQAYIVQGRYKNTVTDGRTREEGLDRDITWRTTASLVMGSAAGATAPAPHHLLEFGGQGQWLRGERKDVSYTTRGTFTNVDAQVSNTAQAAWLNYRWTAPSGVFISPGVRVERFGLVDKTTASPWLLAEWQVTPGTKLRASAGGAHQAPTFDQTLRPLPAIVIPGGTPPPVGPEAATMFDAGVERRIRESWRLSVTGYYRRDRDGLRFENSDVRLAADRSRLLLATVPVWANALTGDARGAEVTLDRRVTNGVSGWISYAYGHAQMDDARTQETFAADYDQRHMVNAYAIYRTSNKLGLSARFRYGSNFPIQGYFQEIDGAYYVGTEKNTVRLPVYARLDLRADWAFTYRKRRLTLFVEVLNTLNHRNMGPADYGLNLATGLVNGLVEKGFPFLPSAGVLIEF
ncbi:MAG: TonB-dependent receptor [Vicinamibacterales bacterium]